MELTILEWLPGAMPAWMAIAAEWLSGESGLLPWVLLLLRLFLGVAFIRHGWPKLRHLDTWARMLNTPVWLCFLSAFSMWGSGIALLPGLFTPLAALAILVSMAYAMVLEISNGTPFIAPDPYQIPPATTPAPAEWGNRPAGRRRPCMW